MQHRRHFRPELKAAILRAHLAEGTPVSELCREHKIGPAMFYAWQRKLFEEMSEVFNSSAKLRSIRSLQRTMDSLKQAQEIASRAVAGWTQDRQWMEGLVLTSAKPEDVIKDLRHCMEMPVLSGLLSQLDNSRARRRNRTVIALAHLRGIPESTIADFLAVRMRTVRAVTERLKTKGIEHLITRRTRATKRVDDPRLKDAVFTILHAPPLSYGINRTTWRYKDMRSALAGKGISLGIHAIRAIIKNAGYRFRKAKKVLTSTDPDFHEKLNAIKKILRNLKPTEKFFSVDEFGPFAVKIQGGKSLSKNGQLRTVPQLQKSKGSLIITGALELSENQITHFYSERKNTDEMIKLLDLLLVRYSDASCIYFSWDAASWHASKRLYERVEEINSPEFDSPQSCPIVKLAPLPACAQFLNVIESVFSGMAKAVIHNSDYQTVADCKEAIDRHFFERNQHYREHPKRAGNKIWGKELVVPKFDEANNCKDPRW